MEKCLKIGPWGGRGGDSRGFTVDDQTGITDIEVFLGDVIDSITFKWGNEQNPQMQSYRIGGDGGHSGGKISFTWPGEYLTSISGTFGPYNGHDVIYSLRFGTNKKVYEPFGSKEGTTPFFVPLEDGEIVGFHGYAGQYVDAIGICAKII